MKAEYIPMCETFSSFSNISYKYGLYISYLDPIKDQEIRLINKSKDYIKGLIVIRVDKGITDNKNSDILESIKKRIQLENNKLILLVLKESLLKNLKELVYKEIVKGLETRNEEVLWLENAKDPDKVDIQLDFPCFYYLEDVPIRKEVS